MANQRLAVLLIGLGGGAAIALIGYVGARAIGADVFAAGWAIPVAMALHALQLLLSARAWRDAAGDVPPPLADWLRIRWVREAVNAMLPVAQLGGNLVGIRLLMQRGLKAPLAGAATTFDMTAEALAQAVFTLVGIAAVGGGGRWLGGGAALMALGVLLFMLAQRAGLLRLVEGVALRLPALPPDALRGLHAELMRLQRDKARIARCIGLHLVAWLLGVAETWIVLAALGQPLGGVAALVVESLGMAARSAGFAVPGALGVQEGGFVLAGGLVGLPPDAAIALSMVKRARELAVGIPGLLVWHWTEARRHVTAG